MQVAPELQQLGRPSLRDIPPEELRVPVHGSIAGHSDGNQELESKVVRAGERVGEGKAVRLAAVQQSGNGGVVADLHPEERERKKKRKRRVGGWSKQTNKERGKCIAQSLVSRPSMCVQRETRPR